MIIVFRKFIQNKLEEDDFYINPKLLGERIDEINETLKKEFANESYIPRVVAFLNMNPHNPLGKVLNSKKMDILEQLGDICLEKGVFVIDDLIYRDIGFDQDDKAFFLASIPKYFNNTITLIGLSKSYGLAQVRAGAIIAPIPIINDITAQISHEVDALSYIQSAALAGAFNGTTRRYKKADKYFKGLIKEYKYHLSLIEALIYGINYKNCEQNRNEIMKDIKKYTTDEEKIKVSEIAVKVKPDFIKTSTGFGTGGATLEDVKLMKSVVKDEVKVKAAGGIRDLDTFLTMVEAGAERIGTSAGIEIMNEYDKRNK